MALLGNYSVLNRMPGRTTVGSNFTGYVGTRANTSGAGGMRGRFYAHQNLGFDKTSGQPNGYHPPYSLVIPQKSGGMSSYTQSTGSISAVSNLAGGRNLTLTGATMAIAVSNAQLDQIASIIASAALAITSSNAALAAAAGMSGSSTLVITNTDALAGAIFSVLANSTCAITPDVIISALAHMEAEAGGETPLSPEGLAASLLDSEEIETGYTMRESLRLILSALVGKLSGAATTTVSIRDINDTVDRIVATVDSNGNRSAVTKDVS